MGGAEAKRGKPCGPPLTSSSLVFRMSKTSGANFRKDENSSRENDATISKPIFRQVAPQLSLGFFWATRLCLIIFWWSGAGYKKNIRNWKSIGAVWGLDEIIETVKIAGFILGVDNKYRSRKHIAQQNFRHRWGGPSTKKWGALQI